MARLVLDNTNTLSQQTIQCPRNHSGHEAAYSILPTPTACNQRRPQYATRTTKAEQRARRPTIERRVQSLSRFVCAVPHASPTTILAVCRHRARRCAITCHTRWQRASPRRDVVRLRGGSPSGEWLSSVENAVADLRIHEFTTRKRCKSTT